MLDKFLEVACTKSKTASAHLKLAKSLQQLPISTLKKIASGEEKLAFLGGCGGGEEWIAKFQGTPLAAKAIELAKAELQLEIQRSENSRSSDESYRHINAQQDDISIQRKMLELELLGGGSSEEAVAPEGAEPVEAVEPPVEEVVEEEVVAPEQEAAMPPTEPQQAPPQAQPEAPKKPDGSSLSIKVDQGKKEEEKPKPEMKEAIASMRMQLAVSRMSKEAFNPLPAMQAAGKGIAGFASGAAKNIGSAYSAGGMRAAGSMAKSVGKDGLQMAGNYAKANPLAAAGAAGAAGLGAGYMAGHKTASKG